jgi:hypothetical protein
VCAGEKGEATRNAAGRRERRKRVHVMCFLGGAGDRGYARGKVGEMGTEVHTLHIEEKIVQQELYIL